LAEPKDSPIAWPYPNGLPIKNDLTMLAVLGMIASRAILIPRKIRAVGSPAVPRRGGHPLPKMLS